MLLCNSKNRNKLNRAAVPLRCNIDNQQDLPFVNAKIHIISPGILHRKPYNTWSSSSIITTHTRRQKVFFPHTPSRIRSEQETIDHQKLHQVAYNHKRLNMFQKIDHDGKLDPSLEPRTITKKDLITRNPQLQGSGSSKINLLADSGWQIKTKPTIKTTNPLSKSHLSSSPPNRTADSV